jgi:hypothetical protein
VPSPNSAHLPDAVSGWPQQAGDLHRGLPAPIAASSTPSTAVMPIQDHENGARDKPLPGEKHGGACARSINAFCCGA